jgi:alpha-tubulin suppressor-like RCC1 family protein
LANWSILGDTLRATLVVKTNGTLWSWGENGYGELGFGNLTSYSSPKQIGSLTNWATVSSGTYYSVGAIKTDGSLWTWGRNQNGVLGNGETGPVGRSSPAQVGSLYNWSSVNVGTYHMVAIKTDGTLWAWGSNYYGIRGLGDTIIRSTPVQVGALTDWSSNMQIVNGYAALAVKTDGTLWTWGQNNNGQLGLGDTTNRSSPVQVGALTNWLNVAAGAYGNHAVAIKTDGTLWTWGKNNNNQLGLGDTTSRSSPVQVGALTTWLRASGGNYYMTAIKS